MNPDAKALLQSVDLSLTVRSVVCQTHRRRRYFASLRKDSDAATYLLLHWDSLL